jgi:hypothetical protein
LHFFSETEGFCTNDGIFHSIDGGNTWQKESTINKKRLVASKTLKEIDEILENHFFIRVHHSHLINLNEVNRYVKGEGGYLLMSDGSMVDL